MTKYNGTGHLKSTPTMQRYNYPKTIERIENYAKLSGPDCLSASAAICGLVDLGYKEWLRLREGGKPW